MSVIYNTYCFKCGFLADLAKLQFVNAVSPLNLIIRHKTQHRFTNKTDTSFPKATATVKL